MTEEQARKARAQSREFPETLEILGRVRNALAAELFRTKLSEREVREDIYTRVQALDALKNEMATILASNGSEDVIEAYLESIATTGK